MMQNIFNDIYFRSAKITPIKIGQFVIFWKRNDDGATAPYDEIDSFEGLVVYCCNQTKQGYFYFPKDVLLKHDIISQAGKGGKRGFRVYPSWDMVDNAQAQKTQAWQRKYFTEI